MKRKEYLDIGFKGLPHFTVMDSLTYELGRNRYLSAACVSSPSEMVWICEHDEENKKKVTDLICVHNYDYDGYMTKEKLTMLVNALRAKDEKE